MSSISITETLFILYVKDQARSTAFYSQVLGCEPSLHMPGMTEFTLSETSVLGLMPETSVKQLLGDALPDPARGRGTPRSEIYLYVERPLDYHRRALEAGAVELSNLQKRDWGDHAAYSLDPDGHVLAFAEKVESETT